MRTSLLVLCLSVTGLASPQDEQDSEDSWVVLAFERGDFEAARIAALAEEKTGWKEVVELLRLTEPEPSTREFVPVSFWKRHDTAIDRDRGGSPYFDSGSWPGQNYLCKRWEAWCLRYAFAGRERWEINLVFNYLLAKLSHAGVYHPQLRRTLAELNELYDNAEAGEFTSLWECLEKEPPLGWKVVQDKERVSQEDLALHATGSDKPVVLMPGSLLSIRPSEVFTVPKSCEIWLPRGFESRMPKGSRLDLGGCVLTFGDRGERVQFSAGSGSWSGIRFVESEPGTTWVQDWELKRCLMGIQVLVNGYKPVMVHRSKFVDCEVGIGGAFIGGPGDSSFSGTGSRFFVHECHFEGAERAGLAIGGGAHVVSCVMEDVEVGILLKGYGKAVVAFSTIRAVLPIETQTGHDCLLAFGCTLRSKSKSGARIQVHASNQITLEGNYWGSKSFRPGYIAYVGPPSTEAIVLGEDLIPLNSEPEELPLLR